MTPADRPDARHALKLYGLGHLGLLVGAAAMHATGSMLPMAAAASASLMLTMPLVQHLATRARSRRAQVPRQR